ncbi:MAG: zinc-binding dehydrogenase [Candidatus Omnitrophica bacterium]|nr:zinc-binding dehydrogenase [Candidatus Omnitrophota bacterium]MDE2223603.1 zinc-binding dehydrogenase [Candidatus Omnitrophota bacterium]
MKAAILTELNKPLVVADIALPEALSFGQVLVKICYSGICGAQINEMEGAKGPDKFLPHLLGHEGSGVVEDIAPGVKHVAKGDHVVLHWRQGKGIQSETPVYDWQGRKVNAGWVTTFNEYAVVSENRLTPIPKDFDMRLAPLFGCAVTTAMGVINNDAQVKIGQSVVVFGVGGVGLNIAQAATMVSANPIVAIDLVEEKLVMARRFGATHALNARDNPHLADQVKAIVGRGGADVVIDTTGSARVIESAYELTHADGRTILVGVPRKGDNISIYSLPLHFKKVLKGSHGGSCDPSADIPRYIALCRLGKMRLEGLVTDEFPLGGINEAIEKVRGGQSGRVIIKMSN